MFDLFAAYATDKNKEEDGVIHFLSGKDASTDPWICVARIGNTAYTKKTTEHYQSLQVRRKAEKLTDAQMEVISENLFIELMADTILKNFGNVSYQGKPLTNTRESRVMLLRLKDFRELVFSVANNIENYKLEATEEALGN